MSATRKDPCGYRWSASVRTRGGSRLPFTDKPPRGGSLRVATNSCLHIFFSAEYGPCTKIGYIVLPDEPENCNCSGFFGSVKGGGACGDGESLAELDLRMLSCAEGTECRGYSTRIRYFCRNNSIVRSTSHIQTFLFSSLYSKACVIRKATGTNNFSALGTFPYYGELV